MGEASGDEVNEAASKCIPPPTPPILLTLEEELARPPSPSPELELRSSRQAMDEFIGRLCRLAVSALFLSMLRRSLLERDLLQSSKEICNDKRIYIYIINSQGGRGVERSDTWKNLWT